VNGYRLMIDLKNIRFRYNSRYIVDDVDLEVRPGDRIGLTGSNGSGKTTLCHIIMGLLTPESGDVTIFGKPRKSDSDFTEVRSRIGFLFQDSDDQLFCPTVLEDVAFGPLNQGRSPQEARAIVKQTLERLKLNGFEERLTYQLSGGEKRLISLATILAMQPEALILDEPTTGVDEETTERITQILNSSDLTYIVISHDREFLEKTTNKTLRMKHGKIESPPLEAQTMVLV